MWPVVTFLQGHTLNVCAMTFVQTVDNILTSLCLDSQPLQTSKTFRQGHTPDVGAMSCVQMVDKILKSLFLDPKPFPKSKAVS
jgi:hypothetical protein